jgi:hypothetical protein
VYRTSDVATRGPLMIGDHVRYHHILNQQDSVKRVNMLARIVSCYVEMFDVSIHR